MDLDEPGLDLGLNLDDASALSLYKSPFGSDSDYSSAGNDFENSQGLFPDASLHDETDSNGSLSMENSEVSFLARSVGVMDKSPVASNISTTSHTITGVLPVTEESSKVMRELDVISRDSINQHDYAIPICLPTHESTTPSSPKMYLSSKCLSKIENNKSVSSVSIRVLTPPNSTNTKQKLTPVTNFHNVGNNHMTKNAIAARENRLKKKQYIQTLEASIKELKTENKDLKNKLSEATTGMDDMSKELEYMRSVLANVDEVSSLIKGIKSLEKFQPEKSRKRRCVEDQTHKSKFPRNAKSCSLPLKAFSGTKGESRQPGICVHVRGTSVSLELCHHCSQKAAASFS